MAQAAIAVAHVQPAQAAGPAQLQQPPAGGQPGGGGRQPQQPPAGGQPGGGGSGGGGGGGGGGQPAVGQQAAGQAAATPPRAEPLKGMIPQISKEIEKTPNDSCNNSEPTDFSTDTTPRSQTKQKWWHMPSPLSKACK
jgi:hypothetical protein